jgi:hypothetical protein
MLLALVLAGCPVETLGIELPEGGAAAISMDDVQRDVLGLSRGDEGARIAFFARRLGEMGLDAIPAGDFTCGTRGRGSARLLVAPWPADGPRAAAGALLISVLKGWDTGDGPPCEVVACLAPPTGPEAGGELSSLPLPAGIPGEPWSFGAFAAGILVVDGSRLYAGGYVPGTPPEALDYRVVAEQARAAYAVLDERLSGPPADRLGGPAAPPWTEGGATPGGSSGTSGADGR